MDLSLHLKSRLHLILSAILTELSKLSTALIQ
jgi:hypothetical protein